MKENDIKLSNAEIKAKRIGEKSARINEKSERIAAKNGYCFSPSLKEEEKADAEKIDIASSPLSADRPSAAREPSRKNKSNGVATAAILLSSVSILLLAGVVLCAVLGIFGELGANGSNVSISVSGGGSIQYEDYEASPDMLEDAKKSVVVINTKTSSGKSLAIGSGIVLSETGYVATNYHVIENADSIYVTLYGVPTPKKAEVIGFSKDDDIAVLKISAQGLRPVTFAKTEDIRVGDKVFAIGCPEGDEFSWSVTQGIVSSTNREIKIYDNEGILQKKMRVIQTDASVNPGNSGGPLVNVRGEVVGIVTMRLTDSAGMGFALPADGTVELVTAIINDGNADGVDSSISKKRPLMGIVGGGVQQGVWYEYAGGDSPNVVTEEYALEHPDTCIYAEISGVRVSEVTKGLDAENKLKVNDIIVEVNGLEVYTIYHVMDIINELDAGDAITVKYYRSGEFSTVSITLGTAPD